MQLHGLYWWIDRWRKSSAFMRMTLEEQGAYRNLLDEAQLRGGALPIDDKLLAKACGDPTRWRFVKRAVMKHFTRRADGWHNDTLDKVIHQSIRRALNQQAYRDRRNGNGADNAHDNAPITKPITKPITRRSRADNNADNEPASPDPDSTNTKNPPNPPAGAGGKFRLTRELRKQAEAIRRNRCGCTHAPRCRDAETCIRAIAAEVVGSA